VRVTWWLCDCRKEAGVSHLPSPGVDLNDKVIQERFRKIDEQLGVVVMDDGSWSSRGRGKGKDRDGRVVTVGAHAQENGDVCPETDLVTVQKVNDRMAMDECVDLTGGEMGVSRDSNSNPTAGMNDRKMHSQWAPGGQQHEPLRRKTVAPPSVSDIREVKNNSNMNKNISSGVRGFESAKTEFIRNLQKEGKKPPSSFGGQAKRRSTSDGGPDVSNTNNGFVPPYMKKAIRGMNGDFNNGSAGKKDDGNDDGPISLRTYELLKLTPGEPLPDELSRIDAAMIEQVCNEVIDSSASVAWEDIAGQEAAKRLIQEVVVWPMMNPDIFKGARAPPKGILLFGPPGTGKTLLGKAIASNIDASFFAISASSLTSKWIGDGEKMVKALFAVAGWMAPSVIFIDEIDSLLSARKSEGEHESSRRLKTEILVQMEGCDPASATRKVLLVGATNRPEELDEAARRRMPKQMYIPLPCEKARKEMVLRVLGPGGSIAAQLSDADIEKIVEKTEGYSGSDMKNLIQEACQGPIREAVRSAGAKVATLQEQDLRPVVRRDFAIAAQAQRASTEPSEIVRYEEYNDKHGAKIIDDAMDSAADDDLW
jgi:AAA+ superfamily predicted ATPase